MPHIIYNKKNQMYCSTGSRPSNQNHPDVLEKISNRLTRYVLDNPELCLTELQARFIDEVEKGGRFLSKENIDIAHHIAISKIIKVFVNLLNDPKRFNRKDFLNFGDAICSTESTGDDKGRKSIKDFFQDIRDGSHPEYLCQEANKIIGKLNCCSRNVTPGHKSVNRSISDAKDPHLMAVKGKSNTYKEINPSKRLSYFFAALPDCHDYAAKSVQIKNGKQAYQSSSVSAKKEEAYVVETSKHSTYRGYKC
ncbi:MAG: hypothetical protein H0U70_11800 [Tatlockia sp.]|nr:hypothetical protein [Tatlockia sp.]